MRGWFLCVQQVDEEKLNANMKNREIKEESLGNFSILSLQRTITDFYFCIERNSAMVCL